MTPTVRDPLLAELAGVLSRQEAVPEEVLWQAKAAFAWSELSNLVAELEYDSAVDEDALVGVRGGIGSDRVLKFRGAIGNAELYISDAGRRLVGKLDPGIFRAAVLRHPLRSTTIDVDASGMFLVERVPRGAISMKFLPVDEAQPALETEWVTI